MDSKQTLSTDLVGIKQHDPHRGKLFERGIVQQGDVLCYVGDQAQIGHVSYGFFAGWSLENLTGRTAECFHDFDC